MGGGKAIGDSGGIVSRQAVSLGRAGPPQAAPLSHQEVLGVAGLLLLAFNLWQWRAPIRARVQASAQFLRGRLKALRTRVGTRSPSSVSVGGEARYVPPKASPTCKEPPVANPAPKEKARAPPPAKGKAPPPPPKPKGKAAPPQPKALSRNTSRRVSAADTPFGQCIHLVLPQYDAPDDTTIFGQLGSKSPDSKIDPAVMKQMFTPREERRNSHKIFTPRAPGVSVLDGARAQNLAIALSKLHLSTIEIVRKLNEFDFKSTDLTAEDLEIVSSCTPTFEEIGKLKEYKGRVTELRDVEQKLMPLCNLQLGRLRIMQLAKSHAAAHANLCRRCLLVQLAGEELRSSPEFRELLGVVLQIGNFINHGVVESSEGTVRGFAIESLHVLGSFKKRGVSALHCLCLFMKAEAIDFLQNLKDSLHHVPEAARERIVNLEVDVMAFCKDCQFAKTWTAQQPMPHHPPEGPDVEDFQRAMDQKEKLEEFVGTLQAESQELTDLLVQGQKAAKEAQQYFSVSDDRGKQPPDQLFVNISSFLGQFQACWQEVSSGRGRWRQFAEACKPRSRIASDSVPSEHQKHARRSPMKRQTSGGNGLLKLQGNDLAAWPVASRDRQLNGPVSHEGNAAQWHGGAQKPIVSSKPNIDSTSSEAVGRKLALKKTSFRRQVSTPTDPAEILLIALKKEVMSSSSRSGDTLLDRQDSSGSFSSTVEQSVSTGTTGTSASTSSVGSPLASPERSVLCALDVPHMLVPPFPHGRATSPPLCEFHVLDLSDTSDSNCDSDDCDDRVPKLGTPEAKESKPRMGAGRSPMTPRTQVGRFWNKAHISLQSAQLTRQRTT